MNRFGIAVFGGLLGILLAAGVRADERGRYLVQFKARAPGKAILAAAGATVIKDLGPQNAAAARIPERALQGLRNNPHIDYIEIDPIRVPLSQTVPYGIPMVQADQVSDAAAGNRTVCLIDSGYYLDHEDLPNGNVLGGHPPGWHTDFCGHGSHVAGTVAALNNGLGVLGVLPGGGIGLFIVKVFGDDCGSAFASDLIDAVNRCEAAGANVLNMSLGGSRKSKTEERAFRDAFKAGVLSVAAAGNDGSARHSYPASYASVISVAAVDENAMVADFSSQNAQVELSGPGVQVLSTVPWLATDTLTVAGSTYVGNYIENAARSDGSTGPLADGGLCDAPGGWAGQVVLCERGAITFFDKVMNVQNGGGVAAVIYNNAPGNFLGTLGAGNTSDIPAISLSQEDGQYLVATALNLNGTVVSRFAQPASGYEAWNGTSMAAAHVSGVAALVWSHNPAWANAQIRDALGATAEDLGPAGRDSAYGHGLVQARAALDLLNGVCTPTESPEISCADGLDNDCDGLTDGTDPDCQGPSCLPAGSACSGNAECCSGKCAGKRGRKLCR